MPRLIVMRHAKAGSAARDFDRPLAPIGRLQAANQGSNLQRATGGIDLALVSSARRTRYTLEGLRSGGLAIREVRFRDSLYSATWATICDELRDLPESVESVIVVGHEPTMAETAHILATEDSPALHTLGWSFSTGMAALGDIAAWSIVDRSTWRVTEVFRPAL
ncbi:phosphohistidine phosphatase [Arcanobacterium haemolyticum]|nr:phosphohistidine phosphatase [Arcanobacterium haemolyticum]